MWSGCRRAPGATTSCRSTPPARNAPRPPARTAVSSPPSSRGRPLTDVFLLSHGWKGDVPAARRQYGAWVAAMAGCPQDEAEACVRPGGFRPVVLGIHWPSLPWGDEDLGAASYAVPDPEVSAAADGVGHGSLPLIDSWTATFGGSARTRDAVRILVDAALEDPVPATLPVRVREAYERLDADLGPGADGEGASPGDDRAPFEPEGVYQACLVEELASFGGFSLGGVLAPLRVLSFWHMKRRARDVGAGGVAALLRLLQDAAPAARFHLMGHSFGCIVVSSALAGAAPGDRRPVASLALVQGAMSLWSFCASIPLLPRAALLLPPRPGRRARGRPGGRHDVRPRSGGAHPLPHRARAFADRSTMRRISCRPTAPSAPTASGAQGSARWTATCVWSMSPTISGPVWCTTSRGDDVIRDGAGMSGAHSDITKPPVAHAVWQAALAGTAHGSQWRRSAGGARCRRRRSSRRSASLDDPGPDLLDQGVVVQRDGVQGAPGWRPERSDDRRC